MNGWRTLSRYDISPLITQQQYNSILLLMESLDSYLYELMSTVSDDIDEILTLKELESRGKFRDYILKNYGNPCARWDNIEGSKAKYYRILIEQVRQSVLSLKDRISISRICEKHGYNITDELIADIQKEGITYSTGLLRNICRNKSVPCLNTNILTILDFTVEDNQISSVEVVENSVIYKVRIFKDWITIEFPLPPSMRFFTGKFARPIIQRDKETGELFLRVCYEIPEVVMTTSKDNTGVLSCDIGIVKPFSAVITYEDGSYTAELSPSKEAMSLRKQLRIFL